MATITAINSTGKQSSGGLGGTLEYAEKDAKTVWKMNSESGKRLSPEELTAHFKANAAAAADASAALILTEKNWGALNGSVKLLWDLTTDSTQN